MNFSNVSNQDVQAQAGTSEAADTTGKASASCGCCKCGTCQCTDCQCCACADCRCGA